MARESSKPKRARKRVISSDEERAAGEQNGQAEPDDEPMDVSQDLAAEDEDEEVDEMDPAQLKRMEADLVKRVAQCIMSSCAKRGHCTDKDVAEVFTDRRERELREEVLKKVQKRLREVFGFKLERDEDGKRFYMYNALKDNIGMRIAEKLAERDSHEWMDEDDEEELDFENKDIKRSLLTHSLMFIFMTKRHTETSAQTEKGVDWVLLKKFINNLLEKFELPALDDKKFGEFFGPAKSGEFISEGWLRCQLNLDHAAGTEEIFYFWGPRAEKVVNKKEMLEQFCRMYGGTPKDWPNHAKVAGIRHLSRYDKKID